MKQWYYQHKASIGYVILAIFVVFALWRGHEADVHAQRAVQINCNFGNKNREVIRKILKDANRRTQTSKQRTPEEKRSAQAFYDTQLKLLHPFDCDALK